MTRCEPVGAFALGRLLPVIYCSRCDGTEDVSPNYDPWGRFIGYSCGSCDSSQEELSWHDAMERAHPLRDGTERY